jgi:predicted DNA-binding transcriptional regulator YafY
VRVLALLRVLAQGRRPTVHELAAEFRTRRETTYRDLRVLQDAGYPITGDERGRLSRPRLMSSQVPDIRFSAPELNALLLAAAQAQAALPNAESLSSAACSLRNAMQMPPNGSFRKPYDRQIALVHESST